MRRLWKHKGQYAILIFSILLLLISGIMFYNQDFSFSKKSGFYNEDILLEINHPFGTEVYYTLDGSKPSLENGIRYNNPIVINDVTCNPNVYSMIDDVSIFLSEKEYGQNRNGMGVKPRVPDYNVDKCTIVRAVYVNKNGELQDEIKASYFVDYENRDGYDGLYVISIIAEPDDLFGDENGINVMGTLSEKSSEEWWEKRDANYREQGKEWEREVYVEFYDDKHNMLLGQNCGIRIHGNYTRRFVAKSYNLYAREEYGSELFEYDFWKDGYLPKSISLQSAGQDIDTMLRDKLVNDLTSKLEFSTMNYIPCALFIDGEYFGLRYISERYDDYYIEKHYGVDESQVLMIKNREVKSGDIEDQYVAEKFTDLWKITMETKTDFSDEDYQKLKEKFDIQSLLDYYATMIYIGRCSDWPDLNTAQWSSIYATDDFYLDGKWRYMLFDVFRESLSHHCVEEDTLTLARERLPFIDNLCRSPQFMADLRSSIYRIMNECFTEDVINEYLDNYKDEMMAPIVMHYHRFYGDALDEQWFEDHIEEIRYFLIERKNYIELMFH